MGEISSMRATITLLAALLVAMAVATPTSTSRRLLMENDVADDAALLEDSQAASEETTATASALKTKLAKLEHTLKRIKKSCVANNVPHELGEDDNTKAQKKPETVAELKAAIKAKNKQLDKVADACMPGEKREEKHEY